MSDKNEMQGHEYDGIREYDNPLPSWWLATFLGSIIFAFIYYLHYTSGAGPTLLQEHQQEMAAIQALQKAKATAAPDFDKLAATGGADAGQGRIVFQSKCAVCHGPELQGNIGPNLTDEYWIHGRGTAADIAQLIRDGVTDKGMPAWGTLLNDQELKSVVLFVAAAKGTHPANPKAPQGEKIGN